MNRIPGVFRHRPPILDAPSIRTRILPRLVEVEMERGTDLGAFELLPAGMGGAAAGVGEDAGVALSLHNGV